MKEQVIKSARNIFDFYRTAPFGETIVGVSAIGGFSLIMHFPEGVSPVLGVGLVVIAGGIQFSRQQFKLRSRLENAVLEYGYKEDIFELSLNEWCDRQTAMVVARKNGCLPEYKKLVEENSKTGTLRFIPHF